MRKGFDKRWIEWIMTAVQGGRVAVDLNGELGSYSRSYKGLRQGDPLSPLPFNLVADALSEMLRTTGKRGVLQGLVSDLIMDV